MKNVQKSKRKFTEKLYDTIRAVQKKKEKKMNREMETCSLLMK